MKNSYSKKIVFVTGAIFASQVILAMVFSWLYRETTIFVYTIPTTGGIFGAAICFYLNKAKMENVLKIKIAYTKFKIRISKKIPPEIMAEIDNEFMALEQAIDMKIDSAVNDAMNEDVMITNY